MISVFFQITEKTKLQVRISRIQQNLTTEFIRETPFTISRQLKIDLFH